jgi:hypothetical protein
MTGALDEIQDYAIAVISISILYVVGGVILENVLACNLLGESSSFLNPCGALRSELWEP